MRPVPIVLLAALAAAPARAQASEAVFADAPGLEASLAAIRARSRALPKPRHPHRMHGEAGAYSGSYSSLALPDVRRYPVRGMDISHLEGDIDWDRVETAGLSFVFMKATDGRDFVDNHFARNWAGATRAGLVKGAYHFYEFCDDGASQADLLIRTVPPDPWTLPPTVDLEESSDCRLPSKDSFRRQFAVFVSKVRAAYGRDPILYVNSQIYDAYFRGENDPELIWFCDVGHASPQLPAGVPWAFWQYGWHGAVAGVDGGQVDLDAFNGDSSALAGLVLPRTTN